MNEEQFEIWWHAFEEDTDKWTSVDYAKAAWNEATKQERARCIKLCGNTHDYLIKAIKEGGPSD